jgi:hypothetical protein
MGSKGYLLRFGLAIAVLGFVAVQGGPRPAIADGGTDWVLCPESEWVDPFTPKYIDGNNHIYDGDLNVDQTENSATFTAIELDPVTSEPFEVEAVKNELQLDFKPTVTAVQVTAFLAAHDLQRLDS